MEVPSERRPLAPSETVQSPGIGSSELSESHKLQKSQRSTSEVFITVRHLTASQLQYVCFSCSPWSGWCERRFQPHTT